MTTPRGLTVTSVEMTVICQVLCWTCLVNVAAMAIDGDGQRHIHDLEAPDCLRPQIIVCHHIGTPWTASWR